MSKSRRKITVGSTREEPAEQSLADEAFQDRRQAQVVPPVKRPLVELVGNPLNDRDDLGDIDGLAESIRTRGLRQPVAVMVREQFLELYPDQEAKLGEASLVVVHGNRRLAAAEQIGLKEIEVYFGEAPSDVAELRVDTLVENLHRKDLDPLEEARAVRELVRLLGSNAEAARALNMTRAWVGQRLALLNLTPELMEAFRQGELKIKDARTLGALPPEEQLAEWERRVNPVYDQDASTTSGETGDGPAAAPAPPAPSVNPVDTDGAAKGPETETSRENAPAVNPVYTEAPQGDGSSSASSGSVQLTLSLEWHGQAAAGEVAERIYDGLGQLGDQERNAVLEALTEFL